MRSVIRSGDNKSILKSNYFEVELNQNKEIVIDGKGSGHGVGMCQWGAIGQSKLGVDYLNILSHYFPGTKIKTVMINSSTHIYLASKSPRRRKLLKQLNLKFKSFSVDLAEKFIQVRNHFYS